ncbi:AcrR family transcriptional regulator [Actinoplanes lutulentus]|uniref:TetR family transcriptional regulator n=1 Tax=Actinoplanes lutulentus TaxID=1287878 RepID=A0A327Z6J7_9ACTN|nr:TetR family transcriptional regulator [Actinoplanes lutulentus]MBB2947790.1 AcrR family transcriptional regulator [Actinoplanes lutulentus]RAK29896.1 TetR family transcriptional regulator [Actinoplanes lutulentus]
MKDTAAKPSLRERTRQAMRDEVSAIATRLFAEQGCDNTTVEQIAAEAGLSRTTFFRYFGTKEDVVLTWLEDLGPMLAAAFAARPATEHPWVSLRHTFDPIITMNAETPERSLAFLRMIEGSPTMKARHREKQRCWEELLVPLVATRLSGAAAADLPTALPTGPSAGPSDGLPAGLPEGLSTGLPASLSAGLSADRDPAPRALVASALACLNAAMQVWESCDGAVSRNALLDRAMNVLHP